MPQNATTCRQCDSKLTSALGAELCPRCLLTLATRAGGDGNEANELTPEQPERYELAGEHAHGGMGRILRVRDRVLGRDIAMKVLADFNRPPHGALEDELMVRFLREARITGRLEHPSITPVHELGRRDDGSVYYTMKLVRGRTLTEAVNSANGIRERLALLPHLVDVANAIAYAHSLGIIHRDIKPDNILLGDFGETVVLDWGIAKVSDDHEAWADDPESLDFLVQSDQGKTMPGFILGTPAYMPPEQARGRNAAVDERSDVYALGVLLFVLLTGRPPFAGKSSTEILMRVLREDPPPARSLERRVPRELAAICEKAMAKAPMERFQTAKELANELTRYLRGERVESYNYNAAERVARLIGRHRAASATALAGIVAVGLLLGVYTLRLRDSNAQIELARASESAQRQQAEQANEQLRRENYAALLQVAQAQLDKGRPREAEATLYNCPLDLRRWEWGYLLKQCRPSAYVFGSVADHLKGSGSLFDGVISPDDRYLLVDRPGTMIKTLTDLRTGAHVWKSKPYDGWRDCTSFAAQVPLMTLGLTRRSIGLFKYPSGELLQTFTFENRELRSSVISDSGRWVAAMTLTDPVERHLVVWDAETGEQKWSERLRNVYPVPNEAALTGEKAWWHERFRRPHGVVLGFSEDEKTLYYYEGAVLALDLVNGKKSFFFQSEYQSIQIAPEAGRLLAFRGADVWELWDLQSRKLVRSYHIYVPHAYANGAYPVPMNDFAVTPDARFLVVSSGDRRQFLIYDLTTEKLVRTSSGLTGLDRLRMSRSGRLFTIIGPSEIDIWTTHTPPDAQFEFTVDGEPVTAPFFQANGVVNTARFTPDAKYLVTPGGEGDLSVWRTEDFAQQWASKDFAQAVSGVDFSSDGRIAAGGRCGKIAVRNLETGLLLAQRQSQDGSAISSVGFTPDGKKLVAAHLYPREVIESGFLANYAMLYDASTLEPLRVVWTGDYDQYVSVIRFSSSGRVVFGVDPYIHIGAEFQVLDSETFELLDTVDDVSYTVHADFTADGRYALLSCSGADVVYYDLQEMKIVWRNAHINAYFATLHPDGQRFYAYGNNGYGIIGSTTDGRELIQVQPTGVRAAFTEDGNRLVTVTGGSAASFDAEYGRIVEPAPVWIEDRDDLERYQLDKLQKALAHQL